MSIVKGVASTIPGFPSIEIEIGKVRSILHYMQAAGIHYGPKPGGKVIPITSSPPTCVPAGNLDCSGFHRYVLLHAAGLLLPDGSVNQCDWYAAEGFKHHPIPGPDDPAYLQALDPDVLYACFCRQGSRGESWGHVWLTFGGWTYESHGGVGPDSRRFDSPILSHIVTDVYAVARLAR